MTVQVQNISIPYHDKRVDEKGLTWDHIQELCIGPNITSISDSEVKHLPYQRVVQMSEWSRLKIPASQKTHVFHKHGITNPGIILGTHVGPFLVQFHPLISIVLGINLCDLVSSNLSLILNVRVGSYVGPTTDHGLEYGRVSVCHVAASSVTRCRGMQVFLDPKNK